MAKMTDYSGEFDPEFSHDKFDKNTILNLLGAYSEYIRRIDGYWYTMVMDRWGNDEALDSNIRVWEKAKKYELKAISEVFNIRGRDVSTLMKYLQTSPWIGLSEYRIEMKNENLAILTHTTCPVLFAIEKEGSGREERQCREVDGKFFETMAHFFNPEIMVTPLKLPPREREDEVCCRWEFRLDGEAGR